MSQFFETHCSFLEMKHLTTAAYHPWTNVEAKQYKRILIARRHDQVAEPQRNWDISGSLGHLGLEHV